jgi:hypothetical protein
VAVLGALLPSGAGGHGSINGAFVNGLHTGLYVCAAVAADGAVFSAVFIRRE